MRELLLALVLLGQAPQLEPIRVAPLPPPATREARPSLLGIRLIDIRPDGAYFLGSACPIGGFGAYTAFHVIDGVKGQLVALPTFGYHYDMKAISHVTVVWKDKEMDLAYIVPNADEPFLHWYSRGPVPVAGAEVRGALMLPTDGNIAVPVVGTYLGEGDKRHWVDITIGPGSSGSCALDSEGRAWGVMSQSASWGNDNNVPSNMPRASLIVRIPSGVPGK
jgi:hypothetical protein